MSTDQSISAGKAAFRDWWANCAPSPDDEIAAIDSLEDSIKPLDEDTVHIRRLIGTFESCHYKAVRHAEIIIEAIGRGGTSKSQGRREAGRMSDREQEYQALIDMLSAWCAGEAPNASHRVGRYSAGGLTDLLGERTPLKVWQVAKVVEKIKRYLDPEERWTSAPEEVVDSDHSGQEAEYRDRTKNTLIHDTVDGEPGSVSLALAIDHLAGCNWDFPETVKTILAAIGGDLHPQRPLALHARNIALNPDRRRLAIIADNLRAYRGGGAMGGEIDPSLLRTLGQISPVKDWLAASLEKTMRLQMGL